MKFNKSILFILASLLIGLRTNAQDSTNYKNAVTFELGGNGLTYSFNYERHLTKNFNTRIGFSFWKIIENQTEKSMTIMSYPVSLNYWLNIRNQKHFLETGIGVMNLVTSGNLVEYKGVVNYYLNPFVNLGYKYEPLNNKLNYKIGFSPFIGTKALTNPSEQGFQPLGNKIQIWGYIGVGFNF